MAKKISAKQLGIIPVNQIEGLSILHSEKVENIQDKQIIFEFKEIDLKDIANEVFIDINGIEYKENECFIRNDLQLTWIFTSDRDGFDIASDMTIYLKVGAYTKKPAIMEDLNKKADKTYVDLQDTMLNEKIESIKTQVESIDVSWESINAKPDAFKPEVHNHTDLYYTKAEVDSKLSSAVKVDTGVITGTVGQTSFTISSLTSNSKLSLVYENLVLTEGVNYTINTSTKTVALGFSLSAGEKVSYQLLIPFGNTTYSEENNSVYIDSIEAIEAEMKSLLERAKAFK